MGCGCGKKKKDRTEENAARVSARAARLEAAANMKLALRASQPKLPTQNGAEKRQRSNRLAYLRQKRGGV